MKKIGLLVLFFAFAFVAKSQFSKASLQASGLTCSMCSKAVKVALEKVPFVKEVKVDIKKQEYNIVFKENSDINFDRLKNAVEDAGFSVASLKVTGSFSGLEIQKDKHITIDGKAFHFLNGYNQQLNGENTFTIVDKNFLTEKDFKKQSSATKLECIKSGKAQNCCEKDGLNPETRVYHVII